MNLNVVLLGVLAAAFTPFQQAGGIGIADVSTDVCSVIEATYTAAIRSPSLAHPSIVVPPWRPIFSLENFVPSYKSKLPMSLTEFLELQSREPQYYSKDFKPNCDWRGQERDIINNRYKMVTSFTNPIFSNDGNLAIVEVSFRDGRFGFGDICVGRKAETVWTAQCFASWIS